MLPDGERETSADGIELRFAVNHLASYHLARRLSPLLRASAPARIVQVASAGQLALDPDDPLTLTSYDGVTAYRRSKLAQVMATYDLAGDLVGTDVTVTALHPATFMDTTMVRESGQAPLSSVEEGLDATWRLVADERLDGVSGLYFDGQQEGRTDPQADDPAARAWVRALSDSLIEGRAHQPVSSRCWTTRASASCSTSARRRQRSGSSAQESSSHGTNGSQIRSTSALLICERSASSTIATPAPASSTHDPGAGSRSSDAARRPAARPPANASGPAQNASAARFPHIQYADGRRPPTPSQ